MLRANLAYVVGSIANSAALFLLIPFLVNAFAPAEYGAWSLLEIGIILLNWIALGGLDVGLMREYWQLQEEEARARLAGTAFLGVVTWGALLTGMLGLALYLGNWQWDFPGAPYTFTLMLAIGLLEALFALLLTILRIRESAFTFAALSVGRMLGFLGCSIGLVQAGGGITGALAGRLLASAIGLGAAIVLARRHLVLRADWAGLRRMIRYGLPLVPTNLASYILFASDRYVLQHFTTLEAVGVYSFAYKVATSFDVIITRPFALDWAPRRFKIATLADARSRYAHALQIYLFAGALFLLAILAVTPSIYGWVAPVVYWEGARIVPIVLAAYLIYGLGYPLNVGIMLTGKTGYLPLIGWLSAGVSLILSFWLIPSLGMLGAAWSTLIAYCVWTGVITVASLRLYKINYPGKRILAIVSGALLAWLGLWQMERWWGIGRELWPMLVRVSWVLFVLLGIGYVLWRGRLSGGFSGADIRQMIIGSPK